MWDRLKRYVDAAQGYWPILSALGLSAYVFVLKEKLVQCSADACAYWLGVPLSIVGTGAGFACGRWWALRHPPTLTLQPDLPQCNWAAGTRDQEPVAHLQAGWYATNLQQDTHLALIAVALEHPSRGEMVLIGAPVTIRPRELIRLLTIGWVPAKFASPGKPFVATLTFTDHRGRNHSVKRVAFSPSASPTASPPTKDATGAG